MAPPLEEGADLGRIARQHLGDRSAVVEPNEHVGDDETALGQPPAVVRQLHRRLELRHVVVAEIADNRLVEGFGLCERDEPVAAPDERVAAEPPLFDGLEQKCSAAGCAQVEVCPERGEEIGVEDGCVVHGYEKRPCRVAGWSGSGCWRVVL